MPLCPADCGCWFDHDRSLNSHLNQARSCMWYRSHQKSATIENFTAQLDQQDLGEEFMEREIGGNISPEISDGEAGELLQEIEEENDLFYFVHMNNDEPVALGQAGPGPSTQAHQDSLADCQLGAKICTFDAEDLTMFEIEHPLLAPGFVWTSLCMNGGMRPTISLTIPQWMVVMFNQIFIPLLPQRWIGALQTGS
jgi:hypothetical protein